MHKYENMFRPAYECVSAIGWCVAAIVMLYISVFSDIPSRAFWYMGGLSMFCAVLRAYQTQRLWKFRISLAGKPFLFMKVSQVLAYMKRQPSKLFLGFGFEWEPKHTQRALEIKRRSVKSVLPPAWYLKLMKVKPLDEVKGRPWIHGVEPKEGPIYIPLDTLEGHVVCFGTTGSGKTRLLETVISQAIARNEVIILIDPKGDKELKEIAEQGCITAGRPDAFMYFHPAFPSKSVRIDPLKNWGRTTEFASRISGLMVADDSFKAMSWQAVHFISDALVYIDKAPTLMKVRQYLEGGPEGLMERVFKVFFASRDPRWETLVAPFIKDAKDNKKGGQKAVPNATPELLAYIQYYRQQISDDQDDPVVSGLLSMVEHNREHLGKILACLMPLLVKLTAGELGQLLSPNADNIDDVRTITDTRKIIEGGHVLYMGLDALSDFDVGQAIGSIILSDLTAVAGDIYNHSRGKPKRINLIVDEAEAVVNGPLIQILNKARGAGFLCWLLSQTLPDFITRLGNEAEARKMLGNCNNRIALRTNCAVTQQFITETFGKTEIDVVSSSHGFGSRTDDGGLHFTGNSSENLQRKETDLFPPELLGMLSDLHYIGSFAGGRVIKGRLGKLLEG